MKVNAPDQNGVTVFMDGSKRDERVDCGIHSPMLSTNFKLRLPDCQAELIVVTESAE